MLWFLWRRDTTGVGGDGVARTSALTKAFAVVGVLAAIGLTVDVALVGHSGAAAVWQGTPTQSQGGGDDD